MDPSLLAHFLSHYGLIILYIWLLFGIFIIPVPEEAVMLTVGILISEGDFTFWACVVACAGSLSGVTFSYIIGRFLGRLLIVKYGRWIGISEKRLTKTEALFKRHGNWAVPIGYYVPGTRHLVALVAGMTHFAWKRYALLAYPAGIGWVVLLVMLGYFAGNYWLQILHLVTQYFYYIIVMSVTLAVLCFLIYWYGFRKKFKL